jgi:hypothetical protein
VCPQPRDRVGRRAFGILDRELQHDQGRDQRKRLLQP